MASISTLVASIGRNGVPAGAVTAAGIGLSGLPKPGSSQRAGGGYQPYDAGGCPP
ncbi:hypothetical protein D3C71_2215320 [compost metagenome]